MKPHHQLVSILLLFFSSNVDAQLIQSNDSIIYLEEVVISKQNFPELILQSNGSGNEPIGFYEGEKIVSLIQNVPAGMLSSITVFLDLKNHSKESVFELRLLLFEKDKDGLPGKSFIDKDIHFKVRGNKKEKIKFNLRDLKLFPGKEFFVGFETIKLDKKVLVINFKENSEAITFGQKSKGTWIIPVRKNPIELKLNIGMIPQ